MIYADPRAITDYRESTDRHANLAGVMSPRRMCCECKTYKPMPGSKRRNGEFLCRDCYEGND